MQKKTPLTPGQSRDSAEKRGHCASATDFLQQHEQISGLLPNVARLIALQKLCEEAMPEHFSACHVVQLEQEKLTIGAPSQASAARLRQKLPLLQTVLENAGWPLKSIRIKVKLKRREPPPPVWQRQPPAANAIEELEKLEAYLEQGSAHPALMDAVSTILKKHRQNAG